MQDSDTALGVSLHDILSRLKSQPHVYPTVDVSYSPTQPIANPVVLNLPRNGVRLRFDGPDQRLRLIEVLDFTKIKLSYKSNELLKMYSSAPEALTPVSGITGPTFRQVYDKLLGPTFPGEYIPPNPDEAFDKGTYVLSYPGVAFSFPLLASAWSPSVNFLSLLSSSATSPATSMAIFNGESWPKARTNLFTQASPNPRSLALIGRGKEGGPDEVELARVHGEGRVELIRRSSPPFWIVLSETTPQDLVAELGPPDAIYRKNDRRLSIHKTRASGGSMGRADDVSPVTPEYPTDMNHSSSHTETDESDGDNHMTATANARELAAAECFYNYFHHGFDILISQPTSLSAPAPTTALRQSSAQTVRSSLRSSNHVTATKVIFHANIPGSYPFNRHRRSRWTLEHIQDEHHKGFLTSECFFGDISDRLKEVFRETYSNEEEELSQQRPMVLNRGWGDSPGSSCELLGGWEESTSGEKGGAAAAAATLEQGLGNTELFGFPGMVFEVLKSGAVSALTIF